MTPSTSAASMSVLMRLWLGAVLPSLVLAVLIGLLLATGGGKREAPITVFFASFVAVPSIVLLNCWVLFVHWQRRSLLVAWGSVVPAVYLFGAMLFIHGSGNWQELGMLALAPFMVVPMSGLGTLTVLWALAIVVLVIVARRRAARSHAPLDPKVPGGHVSDC